MSSNTTAKSRLFVGSSVESLDVAYAIQENLEHAAEVTVWTQGVFELTQTTIQALMQTLDTFDFAVFVFAPDDVVKMRDETFKAARDNVVFELGLFTGGLGEDRAFVILSRGTDLHLPTDLAGITPATYEPNRRDGNLVAALGPACTRIKRAMEESGLRQPNSTKTTLPAPVAAGLSEELRGDVARMLRDQEGHIQAAFEQFEKRVASMIEAQRETAKAPLSRFAHLIRTELSPGAKRLLKQVSKGVHLTREQYEKLLTTDYAPLLEELRLSNLLVPLSGLADDLNAIPVYWLPPEASRAIRSIAGELPEDDPKAMEALRKTLAAIGYTR